MAPQEDDLTALALRHINIGTMTKARELCAA
jgi:hypothetical protein